MLPEGVREEWTVRQLIGAGERYDPSLPLLYNFAISLREAILKEQVKKARYERVLRYEKW